MVLHKKKAEVEEEVRRLSGASPGSKEYIKWFQEGLKNVCQNLNEVEKVEMMEEVESWNNRSPPGNVQSR